MSKPLLGWDLLPLIELELEALDFWTLWELEPFPEDFLFLDEADGPEIEPCSEGLWDEESAYSASISSCIGLTLSIFECSELREEQESLSFLFLPNFLLKLVFTYLIGISSTTDWALSVKLNSHPWSGCVWTRSPPSLRAIFLEICKPTPWL